MLAPQPVRQGGDGAAAEGQIGFALLLADVSRGHKGRQKIRQPPQQPHGVAGAAHPLALQHQGQVKPRLPPDVKLIGGGIAGAAVGDVAVGAHGLLQAEDPSVQQQRQDEHTVKGPLGRGHHQRVVGGIPGENIPHQQRGQLPGQDAAEEVVHGVFFIAALRVGLAGGDAVFVHHGAVVGHRQIGRVGLQKVHLPLQLMAVRPEVVAVQIGDIFAPDAGQHRLQQRLCAPGKLVFLFQNGPDDAGIPGGVLPDDGGAAVGGGVVMDQHLKGEIRLLGQHAVQGGGQVFFMAVADGHHRHHRRIPMVGPVFYDFGLGPVAHFFHSHSLAVSNLAMIISRPCSSRTWRVS